MGISARELLDGSHDSGGTNESTEEELGVVDGFSCWLWGLLGCIGAGLAGEGAGKGRGGETGEHRDGLEGGGQFLGRVSGMVELSESSVFLLG